MRKKDGDRQFWISFSDIMTSLFFVMLILFAVTAYKYQDNSKIASRVVELELTKSKLEKLIPELQKQVKDLKVKNKHLEKNLGEAIATLEQQKRIIDIDKQFRPLRESRSCVYSEEANKYVAKDFIGVEICDPNQAVIKFQYRSKVIELGREIEKLMNTLNKENPEFSYLMVIEGNTANTYDKKFSMDDNQGYILSYQRALTVYQLWRRSGINLRKYNVETVIAGSGFNGMFRDKVEENNKRFSIQIIPKIQRPGN